MKIKLEKRYILKFSQEELEGLLNSICNYIKLKAVQLDGWSGVDELEVFACEIRKLLKGNE